MNHQQVLHGFLLDDRAAFCATLIAKTVDLAVFRQRGGKKIRTGPNPLCFWVEAAAERTMRAAIYCRKSESEISFAS
jgi:hypothetical protein